MEKNERKHDVYSSQTLTRTVKQPFHNQQRVLRDLNPNPPSFIAFVETKMTQKPELKSVHSFILIFTL